MMKYLAIKRSKLQIHATLWINLNAESYPRFHTHVPLYDSIYMKPHKSKMCLWWKKTRIVVVGAEVWRWTKGTGRASAVMEIRPTYC